MPQSSSRIITSWATSTRRLVKYPALAVLRAPSVKPFLDPRADATYSKILSPSRKFDLTGNSTIFPSGSTIKPLIPDNCLSCSTPAREPPESILTLIGLDCLRFFHVSLDTTSVTLSHTSCANLFFSARVISPCWYSLSIKATFFSASATISCFSLTISLSKTETLTPEIVAP